MSLQVFILGLLSEGEHHPYDIKKKVLKPLDNTVTINDGTLYYQFDVLQKKGYIRKTEVVQSENRPEKTMYSITDEGRKALEEEIYAMFRNFTSIYSLYSSLMFLDKADPRKLAYLIEEAIGRLNKRLELIERNDPEQFDIGADKKEAVGLIAEHARSSIQNDAAWLQKLLAYVQSRISAAELP